MHVLMVDLSDESQTLALGGHLAQCCLGGSIITLTGPLGAGKTTLVRGFLRAWGYAGVVKSPTYTLIEPYSIEAWADTAVIPPLSTQVTTILHCDLYRLTEVTAIIDLGLLDELGDSQVITLLEWPERAVGVLPPATLSVDLVPMVNDTRLAHITCVTKRLKDDLETAIGSESCDY